MARHGIGPDSPDVSYHEQLYQYVHEDYKVVNATLRSGSAADARPWVKDLVRSMDDAVASHQLKEPVAVYRGVHLPELNDLRERPDLALGRTIEDKGFWSTSTNSTIAHEFVEDGNGIVVKILTDKGTNFAASKEVGDPHGERELIFARGRKIVLTGEYEDLKTARNIGMRVFIAQWVP